MIRLNARTKLVGLIGHPVTHSVSPAMQNAAFAKLDLDFAYVPLPVTPHEGRIGKAVEGLRALGFCGANVTVPFKSDIIPYLDKVSDGALAMGAVNTLHIKDGIVEGHNTDGGGFLRDLRKNGVEPSGVDALVLGAGGSARGVAHALASAGVSKVTLLARNPDMAQRLAAGIGTQFAGAAFDAASLSSLPTEVGRHDLVINCTPVGMEGARESGFAGVDTLEFEEHQVVYDLVYNPAETALLRRARLFGAKALSGLGMLVFQGAESFEIWTGHDAPVETMRKAAAECFSAKPCEP